MTAPCLSVLIRMFQCWYIALSSAVCKTRYEGCVWQNVILADAV